MTSQHYLNDRTNRENLIKKIGIGHEIATFLVDKNHPNGKELHTVTDTGIIVIRNERTHKMITKLIARPNQIKRYFGENLKGLEKVLELARQHQELGYNLA